MLLLVSASFATLIFTQIADRKTGFVQPFAFHDKYSSIFFVRDRTWSRIHLKSTPLSQLNMDDDITPLPSAITTQLHVSPRKTKLRLTSAHESDDRSHFRGDVKFNPTNDKMLRSLPELQLHCVCSDENQMINHDGALSVTWSLFAISSSIVIGYNLGAGAQLVLATFGAIHLEGRIQFFVRSVRRIACLTKKCSNPFFCQLDYFGECLGS